MTYIGTSVELKAMQEKGLNAGIKHFCGNDQELYRESLSTFFNEQSFRENNLRAFEGAFCNAGILDTMQGFNRIGCTYMAQSSELMTSVLRNEWGYKGKVITDAVAGMSYKTHYQDSLSAGTDYYCWDKMSFGGGEPKIASDIIYKQITDNGDGYMLQCLRRANKNIYYALSRSILLAGILSEFLCAVGNNRILPIAAEVFFEVALMLFIKTNLASFVDYFNGVKMFGGTGQIGAIFTIIGMLSAIVLIEIISCFMKRNKEMIKMIK